MQRRLEAAMVQFKDADDCSGILRSVIDNVTSMVKYLYLMIFILALIPPFCKALSWEEK